ncbi:hypothetical protein OG528_12675 [Streptomyces platensis]|uniref:hypothetical protein n=1 Tax=Streptomyces platensis TaxID=58346 RepID=UPI0030E024CA
MQHRYLALSASVIVGAATGITYAVRLADYGVPISLSLSCALSVFAVTMWLAGRVADALSPATTHRCAAAGCDFQVRLQGTGAAESRKWQEIAASHPDHNYLP